MRDDSQPIAPLTTEPAPELARFYRYTDQGRVVIVDSLAQVPPALRSTAKPIELEPPRPAGPAAALQSVQDGWHWPSFAAGAGAGLIVTLLVLALRRGTQRLVRMALVAGALGLGVTAYFGWVRRASGHGEELLASPKSLIEDARATVNRMNERTREQQRLLHELENAR